MSPRQPLGLLGGKLWTGPSARGRVEKGPWPFLELDPPLPPGATRAQRAAEPRLRRTSRPHSGSGNIRRELAKLLSSDQTVHARLLRDSSPAQSHRDTENFCCFGRCEFHQSIATPLHRSIKGPWKRERVARLEHQPRVDAPPASPLWSTDAPNPRVIPWGKLFQRAPVFSRQRRSISSQEAGRLRHIQIHASRVEEAACGGKNPVRHRQRGSAAPAS
jgi:hypothetical protein